MNRQSMKKNRENTAAIYARISRDDSLDGDSNSIINQKKLLTKAAKEKGYANILTFADDGISGVTMNRPDFIALKEAIETGKVSALFVKDSSRIGRNYIEVGEFVEIFLVEHDVRLVSISDGVDTAEAEDELGSIRYVISDLYARDISKKCRIASQVKGNSGIPIAPPPYGYMKDPENPKMWAIDKEAAEIVRRIFDMTLDGMGTEQIAAKLSSEKILSPIFYAQSKGINRPGKKEGKNPHYWNCSSVVKILTTQEYCGDVINFKTYSKSYKLKKRLQNAGENLAVFKDVHEPIIDRAVFERIQEKRGKVRKRKTQDGEKNMFSGLLKCADCGCNMGYHFNQKNPNIKYFNCTGNNSRLGDCPTTHYVRVDFLEQVILQEIRRLTRFASQHEKEFAGLVMGCSKQSAVDGRERKQKELYALRNRDKELDKLFSRMYEDNIAGKIDDSRFARLSKQYTLEQSELAERMNAISAELDKQEAKAVTADMFILNVRKYTRAKKLTERMLNELIERIEVHQAEKIDGVYRQKLTIYYNCVGKLQIPADILTLPDISMQTRKGVTVTYAPTAEQAG